MNLLVTLFYDLFCKQKYVDTIMQREEQTNKPGKVYLCPRYPRLGQDPRLSKGIDDAK